MVAETPTSAWFDVSVLPGRVAYLIRAGSRPGLRRAMQEASSRWGGMAEPIIPVRASGRIDDWYGQVVETSGVIALVSVDVDAALAEVVAKKLSLPLVPLKQIDRNGAPSSWTIHPLQVEEDGGGHLTILACEDPPLWQVAAAGDLTEENLAGLTSHVDYIRASGPGQLAHSVIRGATIIDRTVAQFGEYSTSGGLGAAPAIIWVTRGPGYRDCLFFWNLRALRPLRHASIPMILIPEDGVFDWPGFRESLADQLKRPGKFEPDVTLWSLSVSDERLSDIAESLGFVHHTGTMFRASIASGSETRSAPFTYWVNPGVDPRSWFIFDRTYGQIKPVQAHSIDGKLSTRFSSPLRLNYGGARSLMHIRSSVLDAFPRRGELANLILRDSDWSGNALQIRALSLPSMALGLNIPSLGEALDQMLRVSTRSYALSDKGRIGAALLDRASVLLQDGVYEAAISLMTPRSRDLVKQIKEMRSRGDSDEDILEIATRWGGRAERRYRSVGTLGNPTGQTAAAVLEVLCDVGWAERGYEIECDRCGILSFVPIVSVGNSAFCPGCGDKQKFSRTRTGLTLFYRLNTFIDRASDQGVLPHLMVAAALAIADPRTTALPGIDVHFHDGTPGEVDVVAIHKGKLLTGEVKTSAAAFDDDQIVRDVRCSQSLGSDVHLMACIEELPEPAVAKAREQADRVGLELLVLDGAKLRAI